MSYDGDMRKIIKRAEELGFRYRFTEGGHHQFYAPNGHDIIHAGGTPGSDAAFTAFMSKMRRAGYTEYDGATTALGEALAEAAQKHSNGAAMPATPAAKLTTRQIIRDYLIAHPEGVINVEQMQALVATVRPDLGPTSAQQALTVMTQKGELVRTDRGLYRAATEEDRRRRILGLEPTHDGKPAVGRTAELEAEARRAHVLESAKPLAAPAVTGASTNEADADDAECEAIISTMLDGFSRLQQLLAKRRDERKLVREMKAVFEKMGGGK